ncbi:hypothetical protein QTP88_022079 [Uroleucon formosanum]
MSSNKLNQQPDVNVLVPPGACTDLSHQITDDKKIDQLVTKKTAYRTRRSHSMPVISLSTMDLNGTCKNRANSYGDATANRLGTPQHSMSNTAATLVETESKVHSDLMIQKPVPRINQPEVSVIVPLVAGANLSHQNTDVEKTDRLVTKKTAYRTRRSHSMPVISLSTMDLNGTCKNRANSYGDATANRLGTPQHSMPNIAATIVETESKVHSDLMIQKPVPRIHQPEVSVMVPLVAGANLSHQNTDVEKTDRLVTKKTAYRTRRSHSMPVISLSTMDLNNTCKSRANSYGDATANRPGTPQHSMPNTAATIVETESKVHSDLMIQKPVPRIHQPEVSVMVPPVAGANLSHQNTDVEKTDRLVTKKTVYRTRKSHSMPVISLSTMDLNDTCKSRANSYGDATANRLRTPHHSMPNTATTLVETENKVQSDLIVQRTGQIILQTEVNVLVPPVTCEDLSHQNSDVKTTDVVASKETVYHTQRSNSTPSISLGTMDLSKTCTSRANSYGTATANRLGTPHRSMPNTAATLVETENKVQSDLIIQRTGQITLQPEVNVLVPPVISEDLSHQNSDVKTTDLVASKETVYHTQRSNSMPSISVGTMDLNETCTSRANSYGAVTANRLRTPHRSMPNTATTLVETENKVQSDLIVQRTEQITLQPEVNVLVPPVTCCPSSPKNPQG